MSGIQIGFLVGLIALVLSVAGESHRTLRIADYAKLILAIVLIILSVLHIDLLHA